MKPTPTEITVFIWRDAEPIIIYRNIVLTVPQEGQLVYYKYKKRKYSGTVEKVSWDFNIDNPYIRARVDLR